MLFDCEQDGGLVFNGAAEAEPRGQRDAAGGLRRQVGEVEDDQAEASAFEQQVGGAQDLLEALVGRTGFLSVKIKCSLLEDPHFSRKRRARNGIPVFLISLFLCASVSRW